jgi:hypothetical protein
MGFEFRQSGRVNGFEYSWIRVRARQGKERQGKERDDILLNKNIKILISILIIMK